ncbi:uncharacterized protein LOC131237685 [Magnolia sinica]|uniref:uncharacterized protein LOC131237685 n=1 Tax=Magnolia sinica TaxID=86752 RepID=UPI002658D95A|nr:uncharacterized protein LOC131237685 [Magnolia sinica]
MRFFGFVSCYGPPARPDVPDAPPRIEETGALAALTCAPADSASGRKSGGRSNSAMWRPSLVAISEDSVVCVGPAGKGKRTVRSSGKNLAGKSNSRAKITVHDYNERFGHHTVPSILPAFAPTAFLF